MSLDPLQFWVVRPGQLRVGELRAGIVTLSASEALIQANVGPDGPIHRAQLTVDDSTMIDGWSVRLCRVDLTGRGSVQLEVTPPPGWNPAGKR